MGEVLAELLKHNCWANLQLVEALEKSPAVLDAGADGVYGNIRDTLVHLTAAEGRYASAFAKAEGLQVSEQGGFPGLDAIKASLTRTGDVLARAAAETEDDRVIERDYRGATQRLKISTLLMQAVDHGAEHRTQIRAVMTQQGVEPPELDGWAYAGLP